MLRFTPIVFPWFAVMAALAGPAPTTQQATVRAGPATITLAQVSRVDTVVYIGSQQTRSKIDLTLNVAIDPDAMAIPAPDPLKFDSIVDEQGKPFDLIKQGSASSGHHQGDRGWELRVPLRIASSDNRPIAVMKGRLLLVTDEESRTWQVEDILTALPATLVVDGRDVELKKLESRGEDYVLEVTGKCAKGEHDVVRSRLHDWLQRFDLRDEAGTRFEGRPEGSSGTATTIDIQWGFHLPAEKRLKKDGERKMGAPTYAGWRVPVRTHVVELPFELQSIGLP